MAMERMITDFQRYPAAVTTYQVGATLPTAIFIMSEKKAVGGRPSRVAPITLTPSTLTTSMRYTRTVLAAAQTRTKVFRCAVSKIERGARQAIR